MNYLIIRLEARHHWIHFMASFDGVHTFDFNSVWSGLTTRQIMLTSLSRRQPITIDQSQAANHHW